MNAFFSSLEGPLGRCVLHALQSILDEVAMPGYTCDNCERLFAEQLSAIGVRMIVRGKPTGVVVHLCEACRAELESQSEGVAPDDGSTN